jgi:ABC-type polysaccharide/polyol phosphate export permease
MLGLLMKGCFSRSVSQAPVRALSYQILLPAAVIWFVAFLGTGATPPAGWPAIASAGTVWLLFANSVNYGGMMLWHERWLLQHPGMSAGLLLAAAALVPICFFGVHLSLVHFALLVGSFPQGGAPVETLFAGGIATASGLGAGILASRLTAFRPNFAFALPKFLFASLVLTPVLYPLSALDGLKNAWCRANPLCVATELARAGISFQTDALPRYAIATACALSGAILCWGLFTLRVPSPSFAEEHV